MAIKRTRSVNIGIGSLSSQEIHGVAASVASSVARSKSAASCVLMNNCVRVGCAVEHLNDSLVASGVSCDPIASVVLRANALDNTVIVCSINLSCKVNNAVGLNLNNDAVTVDVWASQGASGITNSTWIEYVCVGCSFLSSENSARAISARLHLTEVKVVGRDGHVWQDP